MNRFCSILLTCVLFLGSFSNVKAQSQAVEELVEGGNDLLASGYYEYALEYFQEAHELDINANLEFQIAFCHSKLRNYSQALEWYFKVDDDIEPTVKFHIGNMLMALGKYIEAKKVFQKFMEEFEGDRDLYKQAELLLNSCTLAVNYIQSPVKVKIENAGIVFNTRRSENNVMMLSDSSVYYCVEEKGGNSIGFQLPKLKYSDLDQIDTLYRKNIYQGAFYDEEWSTSLSQYFPVLQGCEIVGTPTVLKAGTVLYISLRKIGANESFLYRSEKVAGSWSKLVRLGKEINSKKFHAKDPYAYRSGDNEVLFYSSNKVGSVGGFDIYYAIFDWKGKYISGGGIGDAYNTKFDEVSPSYDPDLHTLFFSSAGYHGLGQLDIYSLKGNINDGWSTVENLGYPINSAADDYFYVYDSRIDIGYFASNRPAGLNLDSRYDDIYRFKYDFEEEIIDFSTTIRVYDEESEEIIIEPVVKLFDKINPNQLIEDISILSQERATNFLLKSNTDYKIILEKEGFEELVLDVSIKNMSVTSTSDKMTYFFSNDPTSDFINALQVNVYMKPAKVFGTNPQSTENPIFTDETLDPKVEIDNRNRDSVVSKEQQKISSQRLQEGIEVPLLSTDELNQEKAYEILLDKYAFDKSSSIIFRVQIGAYSQPMRVVFSNLKEYGQIGEERSKGLYKYILGGFDNINQARALVEKMRSQGIKDAFVCAYSQGVRISMLEVYKQFTK